MVDFVSSAHAAGWYGSRCCTRPLACRNFDRRHYRCDIPAIDARSWSDGLPRLWLLILAFSGFVSMISFIISYHETWDLDK